MSSFYKSNLMEGFDSKLIPPENDPKKEEENIKIDVANDEEENKPAVYYPYKPMIRGSNILIGVALVSYLMYSMYFEAEKRDERLDRSGNIIPQKFLDPCNASNVMSFDEVKKLQLIIRVINTEMSSINTVTRYNISTLTNEYLTEKLANLSSTSANFTKKRQEQKDIRFACFKANLEKRCEDNMLSPYIDNSVYIYLITCAILLTNLFYCISKAKKLNLSEEQLRAMNCDCLVSQIVVVHLVVCAIAFPFSLLFNSECEIEKDLEKFPPYLFL